MNVEYRDPQQKGNRECVVLSVSVPRSILPLIAAELGSQHRNTRGKPLSRSEWIVRAIRRDLAHAIRSRRKGGAA